MKHHRKIILFFPLFFLILSSTFYIDAVNVRELNNKIKYLHKQAQERYFERQFNEAIKLYKKIIELDPNISSAYCNIGFILFSCSKNYEQAADYFQQALKVKTTYAKAHFFLAQSLHAMNNIPAALVAYENALVHNAKYKEVYRPYAQALYDYYHFSSAHEVEQRLGNSAYRAQLSYYIGKLFEHDGYIDDAIKLYQTALIEPLDTDTNTIRYDMQNAYHKNLSIKHQLQHYYQDIIINNIVVSYGNKACEKRYHAIQKILNQYKRPITVLDLNPQQGYFSFRIAHDYDATCVMLSANKSLYTLCEKNDSINSCVLLAKNVTIKDLERLSECEHFDVVLALDGTIAWFEKDHDLFFNTIKKLGDNIIIETPFVETSNYGTGYLDLASRYTAHKGGMVIHQTTLRKSENDKAYAFADMYLIEGKRTTLHRTHWTRGNRTNEYRIESNFESKSLLKYPDWQPQQWIKGINLLTFTMLEGVHPTRPFVAQQLNSLKQTLIDVGHTDIRICNFVIQGNSIVPIDCNDPRGDIPKNPDIALPQIIEQLYMQPQRLYRIVS